MNLVTIRRAILSVSDKTGIVELARALEQRGVDILSTGGTLKVLQGAGVAARSITEVTGFPEILDGRVKTLHPLIHGGLLGVLSIPEHVRQMEEHEIAPIDLVVVNLYPFEQTVAAKNISLDDAVEQIDIGGPTMLRAAAKNFKYKTVIVNPARYNELLHELEKNNGNVAEEFRFSLAKEVFAHTSRYDAVISEYLEGVHSSRSSMPNLFTMVSPKVEGLRYGENPHQQAALYGNFGSLFRKLHGKELSYNNIVDIQAAVELLEEFPEPTVVIIKHTNPCGVGSGHTIAQAYGKALATDPKSAFGGIVAVNRPLDMDAAVAIDKVFTEVVIAPEFASGVVEFLHKKKDRRLMQQLAPLRSASRFLVRSIAGGVLVQTPDDITLAPERETVVTTRAPGDAERAAMRFAWRVAKHVKSNAIVYAQADRTIGVGAGQMNRFDSSRIAVMKAHDAGLPIKGTAVASDAFFPFADGLLEAVNAGATAVIQPGGSVRDQEVIDAANAHNIAMVFTGIRHFKH